MKDSNSESDAQQTALQVASVYKSINFVSVGIAVLLSGGMIFDRHSVTVSMLSGIGVYGLIASLLILWQPGGLPYVLTNRQHEVTERKRDELQYRLQMAHTPPTQRVNLVDPVQIVNKPSAALMEDNRFIPAVPRITPAIKVAAASFVTQLFDSTTGRPLGNRITRNKGQIQLKSPEPEVVEYLESLGIVSQDEGKNLYWDNTHFPTLQEAVNSIRTGVKPPAGRGG